MTTVFIISAPSGSGKSTLVRRLLARDETLSFSVSYTTRAPRGAEKPGTSYNFIDRAEFERRIEADEFLEHAEVFGNYYGTHISMLDAARAQGHDLILDIDVQGARQLKQKIDDAVTIFILAPSRQVLEERLRSRGEDSNEVISRRLNEAAREIENYDQYDYVLVNQEVEASVDVLVSIIVAERTRRMRMKEKIDPILATFRAGV